MAYFIDDLQINKHFNLFKKLLFMEDGEFSLSLSNQLFEKVFQKQIESLSTSIVFQDLGPHCSSAIGWKFREVFGEKFDINFGFIHADVAFGKITFQCVRD